MTDTTTVEAKPDDTPEQPTDLAALLPVLDDGTDRERWLQARRTGGRITATQAAAIVGSHPYLKQIEVWNAHTDPEFDPEFGRNEYLEIRAALGSDREEEILANASKGKRGRNRWTHNVALFAHPEHPTHAATPDAWRILLVAGVIEIEVAEAKATQQAWGDDPEVDLPQHIVDQVLWQAYVVGAARGRVFSERVEWAGKGKDATATIVGATEHVVELDPARLDVILAEVATFERYLREGIAPESDLRIADLVDLDPFEASAEDLAFAAEVRAIDDLLTELAEIDDAIAAASKRRKVAEAEVKRRATALGFEGRRVHLIGTRSIVKTTRFLVAKLHKDRLPSDLVRRATTWERQERNAIEANPEWVRPEPEPADGAQ